MKKALSILLVLAALLSVSLTGCGKEEAKDEKETKEPTEETGNEDATGKPAEDN